MPAATATVMPADKAPDKISRELLLSHDTFILAMDLDETALAEMWVVKHLDTRSAEERAADEPVPKLQEFGNMLDLRSLRKQSVVVALVRGKGKRGGRSPILPFVKAEGGERVTDPADPELLVSEIVVCRPVYAKEHWEDSGSRYGGKLKLESFVSALGEAVTPACPKFTDAASRSAKSGEFPSEMVLRWS